MMMQLLELLQLPLGLWRSTNAGAAAGQAAFAPQTACLMASLGPESDAGPVPDASQYGKPRKGFLSATKLPLHHSI